MLKVLSQAANKSNFTKLYNSRVPTLKDELGVDLMFVINFTELTKMEFNFL